MQEGREDSFVMLRDRFMYVQVYMYQSYNYGLEFFSSFFNLLVLE